MNNKTKLSAAISAFALAAIGYSMITPQVQAAEAEQDLRVDESSKSAVPTLPVLMAVLQYQYVLDPTGLVYPQNPCPYYVGSLPEETMNAELIDERDVHLLD